MEKNDEGESYVVGNPTTKADFRKRLKKLTGGGKMTKITYRANTAANRKKYLKRIKEFYESNNELIINMRNGADLLIDLYEDLIDSFFNNIELEL